MKIVRDSSSIPVTGMFYFKWMTVLIESGSGMQLSLPIIRFLIFTYDFHRISAKP